MSRICLVVLSRACFEGVNRAVYRLLQSRYGVAVHLVIPDRLEFAEGSRESTDPPGEILPITRLALSGLHPRLELFKGARSVVESLKPTHILVDNDPASFMVLRAALWARQINAKLWSVTCENLERNYLNEALVGLGSLRPKVFVGGILNHVFLLLSRPHIDQVFTISQDGTRATAALGFGGRITQMPLGFDATLFTKQSIERIATKRAQIGIKDPTIAYFGRISPEKGIDVLVKALAGLMNERWQLLLDDFDRYRSPYLNDIRSLLASTGVVARTAFFRSSHYDIADYMNAADIVVLPSISTPKWKEQYGRVIPEAMACGKVVIGSQSGAISELIGDCGYLFPEGDIEQLRGIISKLLSTPERDLADIGNKAQRRAHSLFSADRQAEILFHRLVGSTT